MKREVVEKIRAALAREIAIVKESAKAAHEGATNPEMKPENDKDTRGLEAAYLAGAQASRVRDLETTAKRFELLELRDFGPRDPIAVTALVEVDVEGARQWYFVSPAAGGTKVEVGGKTVLVVTPEAPLGQALVERKTGDVFEMRAKEYEIVAVS